MPPLAIRRKPRDGRLQHRRSEGCISALAVPAAAMNKFQAITVFVRVAESGGFTAAAGKLGMSVSAVTKAIARLENDIGAQLFTRTTRQLRTTDSGQEYYERCIRILSELEDAEIALQQNNAALKGRVRAVLPFSF